MADPTASQATAKRREIKEEAIGYAHRALNYCDELGKEEQAQNMHKALCSSYLSLACGFDNKGGCLAAEDALKNGKLALDHCKKIDNNKYRMMTHLKLAQFYLKLQDFGEALINGQKTLSYFEENDYIKIKFKAQQTMALAYYMRALNSLNNKQFKGALDDGEQALVCFKDDKSLTIKIRWLLVEACFDSEPDMLSPELDVERYIKVGKIHLKMSRYDEAKIYFEKAKKDANKKKDNKLKIQANKSIQEANKSIQDGIEGYKKDIACLLYMISNIVDGVHPDNFFEGLDDDCKKKTEELYCSKEFSTFLKFLEDRKNERVNIYTTFFWTQDQQIFFLESVYDLFWKDFKCLKCYWSDIQKLEACFRSLGWDWEENIPSLGPFRSVFDYNMNHGGGWEIGQIPLAYSIAFWRHSKTHYNDYSKKRDTKVDSSAKDDELNTA
ncbi:hypothetical protein K1719_005934 [Acacia pycnantha]|nr:hypothetical protein K1719_005934 [Acacia pycnantha]